MAKMNPKRSLDRMAGLGRMGDSELAHVTPGEMVVPRQVLARDPSLARHAAQAISSVGADPRQYVVGHPKNSRNPRTKAKEYALDYIVGQGWVNTPDAAPTSQDSEIWRETTAPSSDPHTRQSASRIPDGVTFEQYYGTTREPTPAWHSESVGMIDPTIPGGPPAYMKDDRMIPAGAWPEAFRDPTHGVSTYWSAPPPDYTRSDGTTGWSLSDRLGVLPWDPRAGGTGDPYVPWSPEWAASPAGQEVAALMYSNGGSAGTAGDAYRKAGVDPAKAHQAVQSGSLGAPEMITRVGAPFQLFRYSNGTVVDGEGWAYAPHTFPGGQQGYFDTYYGMYRLGNGTIVDAQGQPIITQFNQHIGGSYDPLKVYGSEYINSLGLPPRDSPPNGEGGPQPYSYGPFAGGGTPVPAGYAAGPNALSGTGGQPTAGGWPVPVTPGATGPNGTTTGTGLTPGQPNPYSYPYGYNPYASPYGTGGINLNIFGGQQQTAGQTPGSTTQAPSFPYSLLNAGYQMTPGGFPMWTSNYGTDPNATGGGLNYAQPNSETVDYRSPFAY